MKQETRIGELVQSVAGHDKGDYFLVTRKEGDFVYLCDGKRRKATECKKKKQKHIIALGRYCPWVETEPERVNNTSVRAAIRQLLAETK